MFRKTHPKVLVVGAGPVGLMTALVLAKNNVPVEIVDREWRTGAHSYALALHPQSLFLLDRLGLLPQVLERAYRVRRLGFFDGTNRSAEVHISELEEDFSFVAVTRQSFLEEILENELVKNGVHVGWNHRVSTLREDEGQITAEIDKLAKEPGGYAYAHTEWAVQKTYKRTYPFVIGTDGSRSLVRRSAGIEFPKVGDTKSFAVYEFETDADMDHEMTLVFEKNRTSLVWPLPDKCVRWSFQLDDEAPESSREKDRLSIQLGSEAFPAMEEEQLHAYLEARAPWFMGTVDDIKWRLVVRFETRLAEQFGKGRVWLAGDAAHMTGPAGIQSMNVGLREGYDLAHRITKILDGSAGMSLLDEYNTDRLAEWRMLTGIEGKLTAIKGVKARLPKYADRLISCFPESGDNLLALAEQLGYELSLPELAVTDG